jgi:putative peptidoglycan lipid II flippase
VGDRQRDGHHPLLTSSASASGILSRLVPRGAILLAVLTLASYAMGLVRDRTFARTYGAGSDLDVYNAALALPELILNVLVTSGLVAAFVPLYARLAHDEQSAADGFGRVVLTVSTLLMAAAAVVLFVFAPATVAVVAPGFDAAGRALYADLLRMTCVTAVVFAASLTLGEVLVARQRYLAYASAPLLYNAGIVAGTLLLGDTYGIYGAAIGTVAGALAHLGVRLVDVGRAGFKIASSLAVRMPAFGEYVRLAIPRAVSQPIEPIAFLYFTRVASEFAAGSVSAVSFARNFASVPVVVIGVQFAVAAFPILSRAAADGDRSRFRSMLGWSAVSIAVLTTAAAMALAVLAVPIIETLLGGGAFDAADVALTAALVAGFALSVPFESLVQLAARGVYATRNTVLPVLAALAGLLITVVAVNALTTALGILAIPAGYAIGMALRLVILAVVLPARLRRIEPAASLAR